MNKQILIRIYCGLNGPNGDDGRSEEREAILAELCQEYFPHGCTTFDAVGLWAGFGQERSVIVEVLGPDETESPRGQSYLSWARQLATAYKAKANQDAVMVTAQDIAAQFI